MKQVPQMKKGKGYITEKKTRSDKPVTYGDPFKVDAIGQWETKAGLDEWGYDEWKYPNPTKGKKT